jgi:ATP-dependent helicase HrpB
VDLSETILLLKQAGIDDPAAFPWLDAPEPGALARSLRLLTDLGALDGDTGALTPVGLRMLAFPMHPRYARMLLEAERYGCVPSAALMAALTQDRSILLAAQNRDVVERRLDLAGNDSTSDLILLLQAWRYARDHDYARDDCERLGIHGQAARQAARLYDQFLRIAEDQGLDTFEDHPPSESLRRCIVAGFSDQLARALSPGASRYELVHRRRGTLERGSVVRSDMIVASEIREVQQKGNEVDVRLSLVTAVDPAWLRESFPHDIKQARRVAYDAIGKRVTVSLQTCFRDLVLEERRADPPTVDEAAGFLAAEVCAGRLVLKEWNHHVEQWILRVNALARHCPELGIPALTDADRVDLIAQVCHGAIGYKDIKDRPVWPVVRAWLPPAQAQLLDRHAPERITLPNGREPRLTYEANAEPFIALRIQELYGVDKPLFVCMGRVRVVVHILAPNQRPVQITNDLASFWRNNYPAIKQEYKRRYPKHEWR